MFKKTTLLTAVAGFALAAGSAHAATVWNVNVGGHGDTDGASAQITTSDNYVGAATENTANSTWNAVSDTALTTLDDSSGDNSAGVTFQLAPTNGSSIDFGSNALTSGDEIFVTWIKDNGNDDLFTATFGNLDASATYSLVVYADWRWINGDGGQPITQTAGTGLAATFFLNNPLDGPDKVANPLTPDTNPADVDEAVNYVRLDGLKADGTNNLTFSMGGVNAPISGFQLVEVPEPGSLALLGLGGLCVLHRRRG